MFYVYLLKSKKDGKLYTGSTGNLVKRIERHNKGLVKATKYRRPLKLIYFEGCLSNKDTRKREMYLKSSWGKRYVKNRISNYLKESRLDKP